jgi:ABC-2 type transport system permease protein
MAANGRNFYEYSMGSTHILDFFAYLSARYQTARRFITAPAAMFPRGLLRSGAYLRSRRHARQLRAGLDYYQRTTAPTSSPVPHLEFPRYRTFAQSFPNTVPYSEGIGFIGRVLKPTDIDFTYFVTAHELGHQWWAHQLIGADVEGSNMMSESLAEYSALHGDGAEVRPRPTCIASCATSWIRYLRGRAGEIRHEPPLALVQREPYVWYQKGGQILYTLADYIGEDKVNLALHNFLMQYRYANANNQVDASHGNDNVGAAPPTDGPWPDTRMLVDAIRAQTPPELQYLVDDGFNRIVLYDNKASPPRRRRLPTANTKSRSKCRRARCRPTATAWRRPCRLTTTSRSASSAARKTKRSRSI